MTRPMNAYQFFLKHAGYSHDPKKETPMQGRIRCARELAKAERKARDGGFAFRWSIDPDGSSADWIERGEDGGPDMNPWQVWQCAMLNSEGCVVASLHGIDFGRDGQPWDQPYRRVVEAELAEEGMTAAPQGTGNTYWHREA
jgi:hypothetical protein